MKGPDLPLVDTPLRYAQETCPSPTHRSTPPPFRPRIPQAGEFWYELTMTGEPTKPVELPVLHCAVGASTTTEITVSNPIGDELSLQLRVDGPGTDLRGSH